MTLPLENILVADFTRVLAGPLCTQLLGDEGARVIKVEEPERGDETRRWGPPFLGEFSTYFLSVNRNKESITLDLRTDRELAHRLIERADVVIDNFLPHQRASLLGDVLAINPRVIHCSITGFDGDTPEAGTPGYDLLAQAAAGLMSITGEKDGEPSKTGVALTDVLTAQYAHGAICAALFSRERTGKGARLEVSLFGAALASLVNVAQGSLVTGNEARRYGNAHPSIVPYGVFNAADRSFAMGGATDRHFRMLCERVIERPELANDERFATNTARVNHRDILVPLLDSIFRTKAADEWIERLRAVSIPCSPVRGVLEALRSAEAGPMIVDGGGFPTVSNPVRFDGRRLPVRLTPPKLGQHTDEITRELTRASTTKQKARRTRIGRTPTGRR